LIRVGIACTAGRTYSSKVPVKMSESPAYIAGCLDRRRRRHGEDDERYRRRIYLRRAAGGVSTQDIKSPKKE
jgi:hypothetical protein